MATLLHELIFESAGRAPARPALAYQAKHLDYAALAACVSDAASVYLALGIGRGERIAIFLEKRLETVVAMFAATAAGCAFVPVNPLLKPEQVGYILRDCNVRLLVTSPERLALLETILSDCSDLRAVLVVGGTAGLTAPAGRALVQWETPMGGARATPGHRVIDTDIAAILYTSGSTGKPKGVVLSHRNIVAGAYSVSSYLGNHQDDRILSALPLSFDAGFSQLTTAFATQAKVVLLNYLLPRDVVTTCARERITGLTAVPPMWIQVSQLAWPPEAQAAMRYIANTGGRMPRATLDTLRDRLPATRIFLMYGLTEAFRSTYLPPEEIDRRPDSIGKAIPNAEIMVVKEDGTRCAPHEPGELVHRGALVSLGYWNDREKTAERFRPAPGQPDGLTMPEIAVWSGDTVYTDEDGFIYFVGRRDEMIKTSGYRVSPTEVEEVLYSTGLVGEVAAFGVEHPTLGQAIVLAVTSPSGAQLDTDALMDACKQRLPAYMVPVHVQLYSSSLPRNPNGKIDRKRLAGELAGIFEPKRP